MGLRFRKSISLCKGVKLNFGKTGASISVGGKGYRKTINTKGQVTTSFGIPGTGVYYTETKSLNKDKNNCSSNNNRRENNYRRNNQVDFMKQDNISSYQIDESVDNSWFSNDTTNIVQDFQGESGQEETTYSENISKPRARISNSDIRKLYIHCDETIDWTEIIVSTSAEELFMEEDMWKFYKSVANRVLEGDIDTYLQIIEKIRPLDDLLDYGSEFEVGTDDADIMEVEFLINADNILPDISAIGIQRYEQLFKEYACAGSIRVARDLFALLPVKYVIVYAKMDDEVVLQAKFDRDEIQKINFKAESGMEVIDRFIFND